MMRLYGKCKCNRQNFSVKCDSEKWEECARFVNCAVLTRLLHLLPNYTEYWIALKRSISRDNGPFTEQGSVSIFSGHKRVLTLNYNALFANIARLSIIYGPLGKRISRDKLYSVHGTIWPRVERNSQKFATAFFSKRSDPFFRQTIRGHAKITRGIR